LQSSRSLNIEASGCISDVSCKWATAYQALVAAARMKLESSATYKIGTNNNLAAALQNHSFENISRV
jgi:hypothetical protein